MASDYPATGQWSIYSVQKTLPYNLVVGSLLDVVHSYIVIVDPNGNAIREMHGTYSNSFHLNAEQNNYLEVQMWVPDDYMHDQTILNTTQVMQGSEATIKGAFVDAYVDVSQTLLENDFLYAGFSAEGTYNSNSVWYTAMLSMGVEHPEDYLGSYTNAPGSQNDLRFSETNNPEHVGTGPDILTPDRVMFDKTLHPNGYPSDDFMTLEGERQHSDLGYSDVITATLSKITSEEMSLALYGTPLQGPDGIIHTLGEIAESFKTASIEIADFITHQVTDAIEWFSSEDGANIAFSQWLGANMQDLVNGAINTTDAFIDLSEFIASQYGSHTLIEFIDGTGDQLTAAHKLLATVFHEEFGVDTYTVDALVTNIATALGRFAVDFISQSGDWDSEDYVAAGMMATTSVIAQHYATQFFVSNPTTEITGGQIIWSPTSTQASNISGTVAAVANVVATLLADHDLNTQDWIKLGATTGVAYGSAAAGQVAGNAIASALEIGGAAGPIGIVVGAIIGLLGSKILEGIFGSKHYYPGEFASKADAISSLYTIQQIDDGNGNMVNALISTNSKGSTLILKSSILYAVGGTGSDTLVGDGGGVHQDNVLSGGAGDDYLEGRFGNDTLFGDTGHDHIVGGVGDDLIIGGDGNDELIGDEGSDIILGDAGDDFIHAGSGDDAVTGGDGNDIILASSGVDIVDGGDGRDIIELGEGNDVGQGGAGDDTIMGNIGDDNLIGATGNDQLFGEFGNDQLTGGDGGDYLDGGAGIDIIQGESGDDYLIGGLDNDALDGGIGNDKLDGGIGNDILVGGLDNDILIGGIGSDTLDGGAGNDLLVGGYDNDTLDGNVGDDKYLFYVDHGQDIITDSSGNDTIVIGNVASTAVSFSQDGNDLLISYGTGSDQIRITDQLVSSKIEKLELTDGFIDLTALTFNSGVAAYTIQVNSTPAITGIENQIIQFESYQDRKVQELSANSLLSNIGLQTYHEALRDELSKVYYNGAQVESYKRSRSIFGGYYSVYKLIKPSLIDGTPEVISYKQVNPGDNTAEFDKLIYATKTVYDNKTEIIEDIWLNGVVISTTHIIGTQFSEGVAGEVVANHNLPGTVMISASERLDAGTVSIIQLGEKELSLGADQLVGTYNAETINGNSGDDYLYAGDGNDTVNGGTGNDWIFGGGGNDTLNGGAGDDIILGGVGNDIIYAGEGNDAVIGGDGNDVIYGEGGNDWLDGGDGDDIIVGGTGNDLINGEDNSDTATYAESTAAVTVDLAGGIVTGYGNDILINIEKVIGSNYNDTIYGSANDNVIDGGAGIDTMVGGLGNDTYVVDAVGEVIIENANEGIDTVQTSISSYDLSANLENLTLTGTAYGAHGNDSDNILIGNSSNNGLWGYGGNDLLDGGAGVDGMLGGAGDDTYIIDSTSDAMEELANEGIDLIKSSVSWTLGANVENLTLTGTSSINGTGNSLDNIITGNSGTNTLTGGAGNDTYYVNNTSDVVTEAASAGTDIVYSTATFTLGANVESLILTGTSAINGTGNAQDNTITGNDAANTLNGAAGVDTLSGGLGDDIYVIDTLTDTLIENANEGIDTIQSAITYTLATNFENLTLTGTTAINGTGNSYNNILIGNSGINTLNGGDGDDRLDGGAGNDTMLGGTGDDYYIIDSASDVVIENSNEGIDTIQVHFNNYTLLANFENMNLGGTVDRNGSGNSLDNVIVGNTGDNTLYGYGGNDTLDGGGGGSDTLIGGLGDDAYYTNGGDTLTENANEGIDTVYSTASSLTLGNNFENMVITAITNINATGNALDNILIGGAGNNIITGGGGNDTMSGGKGDDTYVVDSTFDIVNENVGEGSDLIQSSVTFTASANVENLTLTGAAAINGTGNALNNILIGNTGINTLTGGDGNDTIDGGTGADILIGGLGDDLYKVDNAGDTITENSNEGTDIVQSSATFTLSANLENLTLLGSTAINGTGNASDNILTGNTGTNVLTGGDGNDLYIVQNSTDSIIENANEGIDTVQSSVTFTLSANVENLTQVGSSSDTGTGNALDNVMISNSANTTLVGKAGNDTYIVNNTGDVVTEVAGEGTDLVQSSVTYTLSANVENLTLTGTIAINGTGSASDNTLIGNSAANVLSGLAGIDTMIGNDGNDTYVVDNTSDVVTENANQGIDLVQSSVTYTATANVENLTLTGTLSINGTGNNLDNILIGNSGANTLTGNDGNDSLDGGSGADTMIGGTGNDTYYVDAATDVITENSNEGIDTVIALYSGYILGTNLENLTLGGTADRNGNGNSLDNILIGNTGDNKLYGFDGNDTLDSGNGGSDTLVGGLGDDAYYTNGGDTLTENANEGTDTVYSTASSLTLGNNFENMIITATTNINATGNALDNVLTGGSGNNILTGNDGNDTLDGGAGNDTMVGGNGNDTYYVDSTSDIVTEAASAGLDQVYASATFTLGANVENLTLTGTNSINGTGNALDNIILGTIGDNVLSGMAGNDTMVGGFGDDIYVVDSPSDIITENANEGTDTIQSSISYTLPTNFENITLTGTAAINATGDNLVNILTGNSGNNTLNGDGGDDILEGGDGVDTLVGGLGNDTYIVDSTTDVITENNNEGIDTVRTIVSITSLAANIENIYLMGTSGINATGNSLDNMLIGNSGNNTLSGGAGNDTMAGGLGNDIYVVDSINDIVIENANEGTDTVQASVNYTLGLDVENLTLIGTGDIEATGNNLNNTITGNSGNNLLDGYLGSDTMVGGIGNDTYIVNSTGDIVTEAASGGTDHIMSSINIDALAANVEILTLVGLTYKGYGNELNNTIYGNDGSNLISGGVGTDTMYGGLGADTYIVDNVADVVIEYANGGAYDEIQSYVSYTLPDYVEDLLIAGTGNINSTGNSLDNYLRGNNSTNILTGADGNDVLEGLDGNDILDGGAGLDRLYGDAGADTFVFKAASAFSNVDIVGYFNAAEGDAIDIRDLLVGYVAGTSNINDFVSLSTSGGNTSFFVDRDGSGSTYSSVKIASLDYVTGLNVSDMLTNHNIIAA